MSRAVYRDTGANRPLLVTADPDVVEVVLRLAALANIEVEVAPTAGSARASWSTAPLVFVAMDALAGCLQLGLPRRPAVVLIGDVIEDSAVWQQAVVVGAERVVFFPDVEHGIAEALADVAEGVVPEGPLVAVIGGRGGAGATTVACSLALAAVQAGRSALLVDGDPLGGGIDLVFGGEAVGGLRWPDLSLTRGRIPAAALSAALPQMAGLSVLSWGREDAQPLSADAVAAVLSAGRRAHDLIIVDLPRALDPAARLTLTQATTTLLVVPAEVRATAAAGRVAAAVGLLTHDLRLVVRGPSPTGLTGEVVSRELGVPLVGELRPEPHLAVALDRGELLLRRPRSPLAAFTSAFLAEFLPAVQAAS